MSRTLRLVAVATVAALALTGCLRQEGTYVLQEDNTVDGNIVLATHDDYVEGDESSYDVAGITAAFIGGRVTSVSVAGALA